ncbi:transcriptional regulator [Streptomyces mobaraensis]|uniref:Transcriptional regulator n=2 Tax=Streptomyces mobaraensis TaxID=35621 RepID=A0A5N5W6T6_STRMB|nr:transcriptional regulator [Streptomyces mobaraensis]
MTTPPPGPSPDADRFRAAVTPLVEAMGGLLLDPAEALPDDVVLSWEGHEVLAVRLPHLADSLDRILTDLERRHGMPLARLDRKTKQSIVRNLETRGAFTLRHGVEKVAAALGVSRFTVYNYLNSQDERRAMEREEQR